MITIVIADDHQIIRESLRLLLESQSDFQVLAEAGDGHAALQMVEAHKPDVLVLDMMMLGLSSLESTRETKRVSPATKVVILSMHDAETYVVDALDAGASAYVLKKSSSQELVFAIRHTISGGIFLSPTLNERAIQAYIERSRDARAGDPFESLSTREREVFQLAANGLSNPQIANQLSISARTVEMHRASFMRKLGLKTQTDLVKYAVMRGVI